ELRLELDVLLGDARVGARAGGAGPAAAAPLHLSPQLIVLFDQTGELTLDLIEEGVDLLLVVPPFAYRRLLEGDVVHVGRGQRHRNSSGQLRPRAADFTGVVAPLSD